MKWSQYVIQKLGVESSWIQMSRHISFRLVKEAATRRLRRLFMASVSLLGPGRARRVTSFISLGARDETAEPLFVNASLLLYRCLRLRVWRFFFLCYPIVEWLMEIMLDKQRRVSHAKNNLLPDKCIFTQSKKVNINKYSRPNKHRNSKCRNVATLNCTNLESIQNTYFLCIRRFFQYDFCLYP